jgi:hypothetical protein
MDSFAQLDGGFTDFLTSVMLPKCTNATGIRHFTGRKNRSLYIPLVYVTRRYRIK